MKSAATQVLPDAQLTASEQRAVPGEGARLVTTMTRHPGGASVQVHARIDESFTLVYDALVSRAGQSVGVADGGRRGRGDRRPGHDAARRGAGERRSRSPTPRR